MIVQHMLNAIYNFAIMQVKPGISEKDAPNFGNWPMCVRNLEIQ